MRGSVYLVPVKDVNQNLRNHVGITFPMFSRVPSAWHSRGTPEQINVQPRTKKTRSTSNNFEQTKANSSNIVAIQTHSIIFQSNVGGLVTKVAGPQTSHVNVSRQCRDSQTIV